MSDVARRARVSPATVSRVLSGSRLVTVRSRDRVMSAVRQLKYEPDAIARSLRQQLTHSIGVLVPKITNSFYTDALRGIEEAALARGYAVLMSSSNEDLSREERYLSVFRSRKVDGIILSPSDGPLDRFRAVIGAGIPMVMMHRRMSGLAADAVVVDNADGTRQAILHLAARGYRRIGMIAGPLDVSTVAERHNAFREVVRELGFPSDDALIAHATYDEASGYRAALSLLESGNRPRAIFVALNVLMLGVLMAVRDKGLRVPEDLALVGFDDLRWASVVSPPLTMVAEPTFEVGVRATEMLLDRIAQPRKVRSLKVEVLKPQLVVRGSS